MKTENEIHMNEAVFAAGCFWGVEATFTKVVGVLNTEVGYCGGFVKDPHYEQVCTGRTGHAESVRIVFDPEIVSYAELLDIFWKNHDPTSLNQQGPDIGSQYRSAIFWESEEQKFIAEQAKAHLDAQYKKTGKSVKTEIVKKGPFYRAEEYHQQYLKKKSQ